MKQLAGVKELYSQEIVGCTPTNVPRHGKSLYKPYKYHGYTVRGTPNCPLRLQHFESHESSAPMGATTPSLSPEFRGLAPRAAEDLVTWRQKLAGGGQRGGQPGGRVFDGFEKGWKK